MTVPARFPDASAPVPDGPAPRTRAFTAGFADALGERQLAFDAAAGSSLEYLRFKPEFADSPEFEAALRIRVEQVGHLQHPSLSTIHAVERDGSGLALVSKHVAGRRVSELLPKAHGPAFALELIRLVTPALAAVQRTGDGVAHGVLSAERIVVTRDGRLVVVEHVLGSAIESLMLSRERLLELGLVVPEVSAPIIFDARTDLTQLGFIALSLLLGRRLDAADYPYKVPALLDEFVQGAGSPVLSAKMRGWLERAMQISPRSFGSAREAQDAFGDLPDDVDVRVAESSRGLLAFPLEVVPGGGAAAPSPARRDQAHDEPKGKASPKDAVKSTVKDAVKDPVKDEALAASFHSWPHEPAAVAPVVEAAPTRSRGKWTGWIIGGLGLLAAGEAVALFVVPYMRPAAAVVEVKPPSAILPTMPAPAPQLPVTTPAPTPAAATSAAGFGAAGAAESAPAKSEAASNAPIPAGPRVGGMTVTSPIELQVFKDGQLVGSTAGPMAVNEGTQNLEFVNEALGFRLRQTVNVRNGQMTSVKIAVPNGRISINAVPWAEVLIDGTPAGETPLANLSLPIGTHEITFRHPQLGEKKQTVVVKVEGMLRVTQNFQDPRQ